MLKLLPIVPPSAAPIVTPGTFADRTLQRGSRPCESISALLMTTTDCGTSIRSAAPRRFDRDLVGLEIVAGPRAGHGDGLHRRRRGVGGRLACFRSAAASDPGPGHSGPVAAGPLHQVRRANQPRLFSQERERAISTPPQQLRPDGPAIANHYHNLIGGSKTYLQMSFAKNVTILLPSSGMDLKVGRSPTRSRKVSWR